MNTIAHKLGFLLIVLFVMANLALLPVLVSATVDGTNSNSTSDELTSESPNVVTQIASNGLSNANDTLSAISNSFHDKMANILKTGNPISHSSAWVGKEVSNSGVFIGRSVAGVSHATAIEIAQGLSSSIGFASSVPGGIVETVASNSVASGVLRPAAHSQIPTIDAGIVLASAVITPVASSPAAAPADLTVVWPIHGIITTRFGVPEPPYQPTHTGIDISDGKRSGITPIHPFKAGTVIQVIHERVKLGNEVIVDHGGGLTSVYGHMYSTAVLVGQQVNTSSVLGTEGSTGVSTGPHVHFEIRVNGTPVNPLRYIPGQP